MRLLSFLFVVLLALPSHGVAATLPTGFTETPVTGALSSPTAMAFVPDGRFFIFSRGATRRQGGGASAGAFLRSTVSSAGERGLLGVASIRAFEINQYVYVYYTATTPYVHNRVEPLHGRRRCRRCRAAKWCLSST